MDVHRAIHSAGCSLVHNFERPLHEPVLRSHRPQHRWVLCGAIAVLLSACESRSASGPVAAPSGPQATSTASASSATDPLPTSISPTATAHASAEVNGPDDATPTGAVSLPDARRCVTQCVERNQMRAVAADQITSDCERECQSDCQQRCKPRDGQPASFEARCRADCALQVR